MWLYIKKELYYWHLRKEGLTNQVIQMSTKKHYVYDSEYTIIVY